MHALVLLFFFVSGVCGLLYEVAWIRSAGTVLGNTTHAIGTVVGVFMGGLALGGAWGGRAADRRSGGSLLRLYGLLEAGVALSALLVPTLFSALEPLFAALWNAGGGGGVLYAGGRVLLVSLVLLVPTTLMGATLPVLARFLSTSREVAGLQAGRAYAVNTFGGVAGTLGAGFFLIPHLGISTTILLSAALNILIAILSVLLARRQQAGTEQAPAAPTGPLPLLPLGVAALSGFAALVYEIAWTRSLVLALGSTVHAFTLILSVFIFGLALGAALSARYLASRGGPRQTLALCQIGAAASALLLLPLLGDLPLEVARSMAGRKGDYEGLLWMQARFIGGFVLLPSLFLGAVFPVAIRLASAAGAPLGRAVGGVYTANTLGSIAGSLAGTFLLVPQLGLAPSIKLAALVNAGAAAVAWGRPVPSSLSLLGLAGLALLIPGWNPKIAASGAFLYGAADLRSAESRQQSLREYLEEDTTLLASYSDSYGLTTLHRQQNGMLTMRVNGKTDASTGPSDRANMLYVGHLPLLQHPAPQDALCIGLGAGLTLAAMAEHPLKRIDCVEISPAVRKGAEHFREETGRVLEDPRVRLIMGDGRNALLFGRQTYDVIVSQPSNLWVSGMANLFTADFFREAAARLNPGGVMGQWIHAYWLSESDFRALIRTFFEVFPHGWLWEIFPGHDYVLIGGKEPLPLSAAPLTPRLGRLRSFRDYAADGSALFGALVADAAACRAAVGPGPLVTDDRCFVEYSAPRSLGRDTRPEILAWLQPLRGSPGLPPEAARPRELREAVARAVQKHGADPLAALRGLPADLIWDPRTRIFLDFLAESVFDRGVAALRQGDHAAARAHFNAIPAGAAPYKDARLNLAELAFQARHVDDARLEFEKALALDPRSLKAAIGIARSWQAAERYLEALRAWEGVIALDPESAIHRVQKAVCLWRLTRLEEARAECRQALALNPNDRRARELMDELEKR